MTMSRFLPLTSTAALTAAAIAACSTTGTETDNPGAPEGVEFQRSSQPYRPVVDVADEARASLRDAQRAFALDLYREVASRAGAEENLFIGTHSVLNVLAMTYAGARGTTETEMAAALRLSLGQSDLHPAMNALAQALRAETEGTEVRYEAVNSVWLARDHAVQDAFLDVLSEHYDTGVYLVDFLGNADGARQSINSWVAEQTEGFIEELFAPGQVGALTELVLTNAAYLSAPWKDRFDPETSETAEFALPDGNAVEVTMMDRTWGYPFAFTPNWRALELPFRDADMAMVFVLPRPGAWAEFEASVDGALLEEVVAGLEVSRSNDESVRVQVPRFDFSSSIDLEPPLQALGMVSAFGQQAADFSGIDPGVYVESFVHSTTVGLDEEGTTAAAASGEVLVPLSITPTIRLNRPFLFFTYDHATSAILFVGRFVRPAGEARAPAPPPRTDAETICTALTLCSDRTTTPTECATALAGDEPSVLEGCAACFAWASDGCGSMPGCPGVCDAGSCADECPAHAF